MNLYNSIKQSIPEKIKLRLKKYLQHAAFVTFRLHNLYLYKTWIDKIALPIIPESKVHPHCEDEKADLFSAFDDGSSEIEVLNFLNAAIQMYKPNLVIETGTFHAISTIAIGEGLQKNKAGKLISLEHDPALAERAKQLIKKKKLEKHVEVIPMDTLTYIKNLPANIKFDFAFFDSETKIRPAEFHELYTRGLLTNIISFHDTSRLRDKTYNPDFEDQENYVKVMDKIQEDYCLGGLELPYSRGFRIMQLKKEGNPAFN